MYNTMSYDWTVALYMIYRCAMPSTVVAVRQTWRQRILATWTGPSHSSSSSIRRYSVNFLTLSVIILFYHCVPHYRIVRSCDSWSECSTLLDSSSIIFYDYCVCKESRNMLYYCPACACVKSRGFWWEMRGCFRACSMKRSQQGSLFSYFKPGKRSSKGECSYRSPEAKTNGVKSSVGWVFFSSSWSIRLVCM